MMNGMPMGGDMPMNAPSPVEENGTPQNPKSQVEAQLLQLLNEAAKVAADNGVDFKGLLVRFMQGKAGGPPVPSQGGPKPAAPSTKPMPPAPSPLG